MQDCLSTYKERGLCFFWDGIFSQWYPSQIHYNGNIFQTAEHLMMFNKAELFEDFETRNEILKSKTPKEAKKLGRSIKNFNQKVWDECKYRIVERGNILKFTQHQDLFKELFATRSKILVEASPYDKIWGIGLSVEDPKSLDPNQWLGENLLGFILTDVRDTLIRIKF